MIRFIPGCFDQCVSDVDHLLISPERVHVDKRLADDISATKVVPVPFQEILAALAAGDLRVARQADFVRVRLAAAAQGFRAAEHATGVVARRSSGDAR